MVVVLTTVQGIAVPVFAIVSMVSVGLGYTLRQMFSPLRDLTGVALVLAANFILLPLLAYGVIQVLSLDRSLKIGIFLIASAAGAPFAIKLTEIARGQVAFATGLLVLLLLSTVAYLPLVVRLALPNAVVSIWAAARPLLLTMLLPFALAVSVRALLPSMAALLGPLIAMSTMPVLLVLIVTTAIVNGGAILTVFGTGAIMGAALVISSAFAIGFLLGVFEPGARNEVGLVTAQRNYAAAMIVATQGVQDRRVLVMIVTASVVSMALLFPLARALGKIEDQRTAAQPRRPGKPR